MSVQNNYLYQKETILSNVVVTSTSIISNKLRDIILQTLINFNNVSLQIKRRNECSAFRNSRINAKTMVTKNRLNFYRIFSIDFQQFCS